MKEGQLRRPALSHLYLLTSGRMQNCVRQLQPFGGHLALNGAIFLIGDCRHHFQTMLGVPSIFLVLGLRWNSHDSPLKRDSQGRKSATGRWGNLFKSDQPHVRSGGLFVVLPAEHFACRRVREMQLPTRKTGDRLVVVVPIRFSGKALYGLAGVRAAVEKGRHEVSCMTGRAVPRFDPDQNRTAA